jgi:ABC-type phosphate/phosphonate transport system substrate-binding protein
MKRILIIVAAAIVIALAGASCSATTDCPAYGEVHKYQIEQRY